MYSWFAHSNSKWLFRYFSNKIYLWRRLYIPALLERVPYILRSTSCGCEIIPAEYLLLPTERKTAFVQFDKIKSYCTKSPIMRYFFADSDDRLCGRNIGINQTWGRVLGRKPNKSLKSFPSCFSQSPLQLCIDISITLLRTHAASYSYCKGEGGKPDRKPCPLPYGLRNPYRNLKSENSQDYAQKPQWNCTFMNSASAHILQISIAI